MMQHGLELANAPWEARSGEGQSVAAFQPGHQNRTMCPILKTLVVPFLGPPLWSSGQSFWLQIQRSRVRSPALPDFLSSSGSGTGSTQPREVKLRSYLNKKCSGSRFRKQRWTAVGIRCANHVTPLYPQKLALTSPTGGGRSVGMVRSRTKATEFSLVLVIYNLISLSPRCSLRPA